MAARKSLIDTGKLIRKLIDSPALPQLVERMDPKTLKHFVDETGLEDSSALIEYASAAQISHLLEETLWNSARPGDPEELSVESLLRWFDLWIDIGGNFIAEKLFELGDEFCAVVYSKLIWVWAMDVTPGSPGEFSQIIGTWRVQARVEDEWECVRDSLNALWEEYPDFLDTLLRRLCFTHSILHIEDDARDILSRDSAGEREDSREKQGYVTPHSARRYLRSITRCELDDLASESAYDLHSTSLLDRHRQSNLETPKSAAGNQPVNQSSPSDSNETASPSGLPEVLALEIATFEEVLTQYELQQTAALALPSPAGDPSDPMMPIRRALAALKSNPAHFDARTRELSYVANVVAAGASIDGERISETLAADIAMATSNLGASYLCWLEGEADPTAESMSTFLNSEPGLLRLFRIGWHLISAIPIQTANRIRRTLGDEKVRSRLSKRPSLLAELDALVEQPDLMEVVRAGEFEEARDTLRLLIIALEPALVARLCLLMDEVPRWLAIHPEKSGSDAVGPFGSMADLAELDHLLSALADHIRG